MTQISSKRELGAFYTPTELSDILCQWAIRRPGETVLEPSFGGCGFLSSANSVLKQLGNRRPLRQLYGCDIDPTAFGHLQSLFGQPVDAERFHLGDFLMFEPHESWPKLFDVVIGNPPYLPYRKIYPEAREKAQSSLASMELNLDLRSSLWAYFVALACKDLKAGGRMAWVLPSSFLHANYAARLRAFVAQKFDHAHAFELEERLFLGEGTEERSIILIAENMSHERTTVDGRSSDIPLTHCKNLSELRNALQSWPHSIHKTFRSCGNSVEDGLNAAVRQLLGQLRNSPSTKRLGDHVDIRIGLVTGNNRFFVLSESEVNTNGLDPSSLTPILSKFRHAPGLELTAREHREALKSGVRGYLVSCENEPNASPALKAYLGKYSATEREKCRTFKKRKIWCQPDDGNPPDAFFPVMHHAGPRLILNPDRLQCTNTVHRAYFKLGLSSSEKRLIGLSMLSSFSQLSAEIAGRSYGAGVLKHEPRESEQIEILLPKLHGNKLRSIYQQTDALLRNGQADRARQAIDEVLLKALGRSNFKKEARLLETALSGVRSARHR